MIPLHRRHRHEEQDENKARALSEAFAKTAHYRQFVNSAFFSVPYPNYIFMLSNSKVQNFRSDSQAAHSAQGAKEKEDRGLR
jgi:hypothetical protein